jgi:signal transduction histidine kinase
VEAVLARLLKAGRPTILGFTIVLVVVATLLDWASGNNISLASLYIVPMMIGAIALRPAEIGVLALVCSYLRSWFDTPGTSSDLALRFLFAALAYLASGLFIKALLRNHALAVEHLSEIQSEQQRRREAEEQLRVLAESSPAAILTADATGIVLNANAAAHNLLMIKESGALKGRQIIDYIPFLADALRLDEASVGLRTAVKCQGRRENGEIFLAHIWFSAYRSPGGKRLAAIVVDSSEEMRDREEEGLHHLLTGNQIATAAIAHEVRNVSEAMAMLCEDLRRRHDLAQDTALRGLDSLVGGLEAIASFELQAGPHEVDEVPLREVLDNFRIVIEPAWREIDGVVLWRGPEDLPSVKAEPHGLLQVCLNLAQNSLRAVQERTVRELQVAVSQQAQKVMIRFQDSGQGIASPAELFRPFQQGAIGSGLGLYVSRFLIRRYGGELRFEPSPEGSCFVIELDAVKGRA